VMDRRYLDFERLYVPHQAGGGLGGRCVDWRGRWRQIVWQ
jgi:hypothetical protein